MGILMRSLAINSYPANAFEQPICHLVYQTALSLQGLGEVVCLPSVNDRLIKTGNWKHIEKEMHPSSWETWTTHADRSFVDSGTRTAVWILEHLLKLYGKREMAFLGEQMTAGDVESPDKAAEVMAGLQALFHGSNGSASVPLFDFRSRAAKPEDTLLGNRYLCRGGGMLFVGPSGMGKSSASVQQDIQWSLGRPSFGIAPAKPLKILTIQAEDDDGDIHEMVAGVCAFLKISEEEAQEARERCIYVPHKSTTGARFLSFLRRQLEKHRPDLLRINPLQAYLGGDIKNPEKTADFLRTGINPLLEEFNCAVIIVHHTPKTNFRDTEEWKTSDWMYAGAGSADITNWARAILIADPTDSAHVFEWIAAKRGRRIGWADESGAPVIKRHFSHSTNGGIHWDDSLERDIPAPKKKGGSKVKHTEAQILEHMSLIEARTVGAIRRATMENTGMSKATFFDLWGPLKESGKVIVMPEGCRKII